MARDTSRDLNDEPAGGADPETEQVRGVAEEGEEFEAGETLDEEDEDADEEEDEEGRP